MENKKIKIWAGVIVGIFLLAIFYLSVPLVSVRFPLVSVLKETNGTRNSGGLHNYFANLNLEARAVLVFDLATDKPIFETNSQSQLPLASLTKIMTVLVAEENATKDISKLVSDALMKSDNEAAILLASLDGNFVGLMNEKAKEIGLNQTYFLNSTGLDVSTETAGAVGSAKDVVKLIIYALKSNPDFFEASLSNSSLNTNPYATTTTLLIGSKTGTTDLAGGNLAIIFDAGFNHPVVSVVLGSTEQGRFSDTKKLIDATFKYLENNL